MMDLPQESETERLWRGNIKARGDARSASPLVYKQHEEQGLKGRALRPFRAG